MRYKKTMPHEFDDLHDVRRAFRGRRLLPGALCLFFALFCLGGTVVDVAADHASLRGGAAARTPAARGGSAGWAFGSAPAGDARWQKGISGSALPERAVRREKKRPAPPVADGDDELVMRLHARQEAARPKGGVNVGWKEDKAAWRSDSARRARRPDEVFALHSRHVLHAQAYVGDDNASLGVGPQIIIKDRDSDSAMAKDYRCPDSAVGFGMQFKIGF